MIDPPVTSCPPKAFTPSRCAFESRPFLELPKPFLCAITFLGLKTLINCKRGKHPALAYFFFLPLAAAFLAALFFLGLLFDLPLAALAVLGSPSPVSSALAFLGLRAGRSGAVKRSPSKAISVILTEVKGCRWP